MMRASPAPAARALSTNSAWRTTSVGARAMRARLGAVTRATARITFCKVAPSSPASAIARMIDGKVNSTSITRMASVSTQPR